MRLESQSNVNSTRKNRKDVYCSKNAHLKLGIFGTINILSIFACWWLSCTTALQHKCPLISFSTTHPIQYRKHIGRKTYLLYVQIHHVWAQNIRKKSGHLLQLQPHFHLSTGRSAKSRHLPMQAVEKSYFPRNFLNITSSSPEAARHILYSNGTSASWL